MSFFGPTKYSQRCAAGVQGLAWTIKWRVIVSAVPNDDVRFLLSLCSHTMALAPLPQAAKHSLDVIAMTMHDNVSVSGHPL